MKITKKTKRLLKCQEVETKLALEIKNNEEVEVHKLNSMPTITFVEEVTKKSMSERDLVHK